MSEETGKTVRLPVNLIEMVEQAVKESPDLVGRELETFIIAAVRDYAAKLSDSARPGDCVRCGRPGVWAKGNGKYRHLEYFEHQDTRSPFCQREDVEAKR